MRVIRWRNASTGAESLTITSTGVYFPVGKTDSGFKLKLRMASGGQTASVETVRDANGTRTGQGSLSVSGTAETTLGAIVSLATGIIVNAISGTLNAILDDETAITSWPDSLGRFPDVKDATAYVHGSTPPVGLLATCAGNTVVWRGASAGGWVANTYSAPYISAQSERTNPFGTASDFPIFDAAWNNLSNASADLTLGFVGDSTTQGVRNVTKPNAGAFPDFFGRLLNERIGVEIGFKGLPPTAIDGNSFWVKGAGWVYSNLGAALYGGLECPVGVSTTSTWTAPELGIEWDKAEVIYIKVLGGGTFNASATGGSSVQGNCSGTATYVYNKVTITAASPSRNNVISITPTDASQHIWIVGVSAWNSYSKTLFVNNNGVGGSTTTRWNTAVGSLYGDAVNQFMGSALTFISLGLNETSADPSTYIARLQTLVTRVKAYSDVVVMSPFYVSPTADNLTKISDLAGMESAIASQITGASKIIPMFTLMQKYKIPFWGTAGGQNWHPTTAGYKKIADILWENMVG